MQSTPDSCCLFANLKSIAYLAANQAAFIFTVPASTTVDVTLTNFSCFTNKQCCWQNYRIVECQRDGSDHFCHISHQLVYKMTSYSSLIFSLFLKKTTTIHSKFVVFFFYYPENESFCWLVWWISINPLTLFLTHLVSLQFFISQLI